MWSLQPLTCGVPARFGSGKALPSELADRIAPSAGLRNVLVHRYLDIDPKVVASAVEAAANDFRQHQRAIAEWFDTQG